MLFITYTFHTSYEIFIEPTRTPGAFEPKTLDGINELYIINYSFTPSPVIGICEVALYIFTNLLAIVVMFIRVYPGLLKRSIFILGVIYLRSNSSNAYCKQLFSF